MERVSALDLLPWEQEISACESKRKEKEKEKEKEKKKKKKKKKKRKEKKRRRTTEQEILIIMFFSIFFLGMRTLRAEFFIPMMPSVERLLVLLSVW